MKDSEKEVTEVRETQKTTVSQKSREETIIRRENWTRALQPEDRLSGPGTEMGPLAVTCRNLSRTSHQVADPEANKGV